jgi:hypothetical protein
MLDGVNPEEIGRQPQLALLMDAKIDLKRMK